MNQDPNPIDPTKAGKITFAVNGNKVPFDAEMIPKLFVAYVAAMRAEYYAGVDDSRNPGCFEQVFHEEIRHAMRARSEIKDWMENNMDAHLEKADEIGVFWAAGVDLKPCEGSGAGSASPKLSDRGGWRGSCGQAGKVVVA